MPPVSDADCETGTPPYKDFRPIREGYLERRDSGYSSLCTRATTHTPILDTFRSLPEPGGQDSPGRGLCMGPDQRDRGGKGSCMVRETGGLGEIQSSGFIKTQREGEDAESGGERLLGRESMNRREALKEGSGTEGQGEEGLMQGKGDRGERRDLEGLHQDIERGEDAESGGEMPLGRESPDRREALKGGSGSEGQGEEGLMQGQGDRGEIRGSKELYQEKWRGGEDAESGAEILLGRESPDRGEALKEGFGTEQKSLIPRTGPEGSTKTPPGEKSRKWKLLPPKGTLSSRVLLCAVCGLSMLLLVLLGLTLARLTGHCLSQDATGPPCSETCPVDWLYSRNTCYYFSTIYRKEGDWDESQKYCSSQKGSLALFDTQEDLNFLLDISREHHPWVGLRKSEDGIHWANGTACSSSLCSISDSGECAFIGFRAVWLSSCGLRRPYICTKEPYV